MADSAIDIFNRIGAVDDAAQEHGIRPELLHAVMQQESGGRQSAVSAKGATGVLQVMPNTARNPGFGVAPFNPANPEENLRGGTAYLKAMLDKYHGDETLALAAYNAGPGNVDKVGGVPNFPETQTYVKTILDRAKAPHTTTSASSAIDLFNSLGTDTAPADQAHAQLEDAGTRFAKGAWENLDPIAAVKGLVSAASHPVDTYHNLVDASAGQFTKAKSDYDQGHYSEMVGHGAAGMLPMIGPAAAKAGETIGKGEDIAGGLGQAAGLLGSVVAPELAGKAMKTAGSVMSKGAERVITSNVKPGALIKKNPTVNIPRVILDEKFSPGFKGRDQALGVTKDLSDQVSALNAADSATGKTYSINELETALEAKRAHYLESSAGADNVAAIDSALNDLRNHPLYSKEKMGTVMVDKHLPASTVLAANGQPMSPARIIQVPEQQVVGRELVPQDATTLDKMKRGIYEDNPSAYGERKGAAVEGDKAQGRVLKNIMDRNVDGVQALNKRQSGVIVARKALDTMGGREASKYPIGLMDLLAMGGGGVVGGLPGAALAGAAVKGSALLMKHPTTAFPLARAIDHVGAATRATAPLAKAGAGAAVVGEQIDNTPPNNLQSLLAFLRQRHQ